VHVSNGHEICAVDLTPQEQEFVAAQLGVDPDQLAVLNICAYVQVAADGMIGEIGKEYELMITTSGGQQMNALTEIFPPVPLDSIWFETFGSSDSLGFIHAFLADPPNVINAYRWSAQRINLRPGTSESKDAGFVYPTGSAFEDRFFDGLQFEIIYNRGAGANDEEEPLEEEGFFKDTDTVAIRFASIPIETYEYVNGSDQAASNNGSPFAVPANLPSNVNGGLGLWSGYSLVVDTFPYLERVLLDICVVEAA